MNIDEHLFYVNSIRQTFLCWFLFAAAFHGQEKTIARSVWHRSRAEEEEEGESRKQLTEIEAGRSSPPSAYTMLRLEPKKGKNRHG